MEMEVQITHAHLNRCSWFYEKVNIEEVFSQYICPAFILYLGSKYEQAF